MTLVICPNLAVDRMLVTDVVRPGGMSRCRELRTQAGGKGANVVRATIALGGHAELVGLTGGRTGRLFAELAAQEGLGLRTTPVRGETRVSTVVLGDDGSVTRLYETGPQVTPAEADGLVDLAARREAEPDEWALVTGAAPPGAPPDFYARLLTAARSRGFRVLVDATGDQLARALAVGPDLVKVNLAEACDALGDAGPSCEDERAAGRDRLVDEAVALARRLCVAGAAGAVLTLGAAGAAGIIDGAAWQVTAPPVRTVSPVGSGDCFAAALALALQRGEGRAAALRAAAGAGAANAASPYNGDVDAGLAARLAGAATAGPPLRP